MKKKIEIIEAEYKKISEDTGTGGEPDNETIIMDDDLAAKIKNDFPQFKRVNPFVFGVLTLLIFLILGILLLWVGALAFIFIGVPLVLMRTRSGPLKMIIVLSLVCWLVYELKFKPPIAEKSQATQTQFGIPAVGNIKPTGSNSENITENITEK